MAINKNHEFEELNGVKCGIVEKNVSPGRAAFLKQLLEFNKFTVIIAPSPPPKVPPPPPPLPVDPNNPAAMAPPPPPTVPVPETFSVGVTDITFNPINAIFGRLLHSPDGHVVTQAFWNQKETVSDDEVPYYEKKN